MQEDKEPLFEAADTLRGSLQMARAVAESVVLRPAIPARAAAESWVVATDLAEALARKGVPFHTGHKLVGSLVLESVRSGRHPSSWTAEELAAFSPEFTPEMVRLMDPAEGMKTRVVPGGTAPETVRRALAEAEHRLKAMG
jgi:argininosuccinate lyase